MNETSVYALPADWPQPEFRLGEKVWDREADWLYEPFEVIGLYLDRRYAHLGEIFWTYSVANQHGQIVHEFPTDQLTREPLPEWKPVPLDEGWDPFFDDELYSLP